MQHCGNIELGLGSVGEAQPCLYPNLDYSWTPSAVTWVSKYISSTYFSQHFKTNTNREARSEVTEIGWYVPRVQQPIIVIDMYLRSSHFSLSGKERREGRQSWSAISAMLSEIEEEQDIIHL